MNSIRLFFFINKNAPWEISNNSFNDIFNTLLLTITLFQQIKRAVSNPRPWHLMVKQIAPNEHHFPYNNQRNLWRNNEIMTPTTQTGPSSIKLLHITIRTQETVTNELITHPNRHFSVSESNSIISDSFSSIGDSSSSTLLVSANF